MRAFQGKGGLCRFVALFIALSLPFAVIAVGEEAPTSPPKPAEESEPSPEEIQARIAELINQLGASEFARRDAAQKELSEIGEPARVQLAKALNHEDKEIVFRVTQLLKDLELANVTLEVVDRHGKPIGGKEIRLSINRPAPGGFMQPTRPESPPIVIEETLSKDGRLSLGKLEPGVYNAAMDVQGYRKQNLEMSLGKGRYIRRVTAYLGGHIKVRVVDIKNGRKPVPSWPVSVRDTGGHHSPLPSPSGDSQAITTDEKGEFLFKDLPPGPAYVTMERRGGEYQPVDGEWSRQTDVVDEKTTEVTIEVMEDKWFYGVLKFKILGPDGKPFRGDIRLHFRPLNESDKPPDFYGYPSTITSGAFLEDGFFKAGRVEKGKYQVVICVKGCAPHTLNDFEIKGNETIELPEPVKLRRGLHLRVKVAGTGGKPLENAFVLLADTNGPPRIISQWQYQTDSDVPGEWDTAKSDKEGMVKFDSVAEGKYAVRVYHQTLGVSDEMTVELKDGGEVPLLNIKYAERTTILLKVVDKDTGGAVAGLQPMFPDYLIGTEKPEEREEHIRMQTPTLFFMPERDPKGRLILTPSLKGRSLILMAEGYKTATYKIEEMPAGKTTEVKIQMEKFGKGGLKIKLVPGKGLKLEEIAEVYCNSMAAWQQGIMAGFGGGASLFRWGCRATPGKGGSFEAKDILEGPCYISVFTRENRLLALFRADVEKKKVGKLTLNLPGVGKVEGTLRDDAGKPTPGVEMTLMPDSMMLSTAMSGSRESAASVLITAMTDEKGRFSFDAVPEGAHRLFTRESDFWPDIRHVAVKPGEVKKIEFRRRKPVDVTVTVKLPEGEKEPEITFANLAAVGANPTGVVPLNPSAAEPSKLKDGKVRFTGLYPGRYYLLIVKSPGFTGILREIEVKPGTKNIEIEGTFKPGGCSVSGKLTQVSPSGLFFGMEFLIAWGERHLAACLVGPDKLFKLEGLHPGKYRLFTMSLDEMCVNGAKYFSVKEITVEEGADIEGITIP